MNEEWLPVPGWEGYYEVSSQGRVRNVRPGPGRVVGRVLDPSPDYEGYRRVNLRYHERVERFYVHRLVALAFVPNPDGYPVVRHIDDNQDDNSAANLTWGTVTDNNMDTVRNGHHVAAAQTHCVHGHEFTPENTYIVKTTGRRRCRACQTRRFREARARKRARGAAAPIEVTDEAVHDLADDIAGQFVVEYQKAFDGFTRKDAQIIAQAGIEAAFKEMGKSNG